MAKPSISYSSLPLSYRIRLKPQRRADGSYILVCRWWYAIYVAFKTAVNAEFTQEKIEDEKKTIEFKFCEDCKWCSNNYLNKWFHKSFAKCMHPACLSAKVYRRDIHLASDCATVRQRNWGCGADGDYWESNEEQQ